jgi:nitrogen fixation NifU-like protein
MNVKYSDILIDHFNHPRNAGELAAPDGIGKAGQGDHEYVVIRIRVREDVIAEIAQQAAGCEPAVAAASMATELAKGKHLDEASLITQDTIASALGGLPADKCHTAGLAAEALANAIMDYVLRCVEKQHSPQRSQRTQSRKRIQTAKKLTRMP